MIHPSAILIVPLLLSVQEPAEAPVIEDAQERPAEPADEGVENPPPPVEVMSMHYRGLDALMPSEKDARLLGALRMLDDRLAELPAEFDEARMPPGALSLLTRVAQGPMAMRIVAQSQPIAGMMAPVYGELRLPGKSGGEARAIEQDVFRLFEALGMTLQPAPEGELTVIPAPVPLWTGALGRDWVTRFGKQVEIGAPSAPRFLPAGARPACSARLSYAAMLDIFTQVGAASGDPSAEMMREQFAAFGLDRMTLEYALGFDAERSYETVAVEGYGAMMEAMGMPIPGPLDPDRVRWIPEDAGWAAVMRFDWGAYVEVVEDMAAEQSGMDIDLFAEADAALGIDVRADLLDTLGEHFLLYGSDTTGGGGLASMVMAMDLADPERFQETMDSLMGRLTGIAREEMDGYLQFRSWQADAVTFTSLQTPGIPMPMEPTMAVVGDAIILAATPQAAVAAARQITTGQRSLLDQRRFQEQLPAEMATAQSVVFLDLPRYVGDGYGMTSMLCSALANGVRSRDTQRDPGMILPTYAELSRGAKAWVGVSRMQEGAMVTETRADRSHLVNAAGVLGWFVDVPGPLVLGAVAAGMANQREFERGFQRAMGMPGGYDGGPTEVPAPGRAPTGGLDPREARAWDDIQEIYEALDAYAASNDGRYPATLQELARPDERGNQFLPEAPVDPWGHPYEYVAPEGEGDVPYVWSKGIEDLHGGGADDDQASTEGADVIEQFDREMHAFEVERARADLGAIEAALGEYFILHHEYPESLEVLVTPDENGHTFLRQRTVPEDPWGNVYDYAPPKEEGRDPRLRSLGADGKPGGTGPDADVYPGD